MPTRNRDRTYTLTPEDKSLIRLLCLGHTTATVAALWRQSHRTIDSRRQRIYTALNLRRTCPPNCSLTSALITYAHKHNLCGDEGETP